MISATAVIERLKANQRRLVLAESCTGGLVAAELAKVPGASNWLCGSAVTYRSATKIAWLGVDQAVVERHTAVSSQVAAQMVIGVLQMTPEADIAASITGHLGPDAPINMDGVVFIAVARQTAGQPEVSRHELENSSRIDRQNEAMHLVLRELWSRIG